MYQYSISIISITRFLLFFSESLNDEKINAIDLVNYLAIQDIHTYLTLTITALVTERHFIKKQNYR